MKVLKINGKDVFLRYNIENIKKLSAIGITLNTFSNSMKEIDITPIAIMFHYGVKSLLTDVTEYETDKMIDDYFDESGDFESLAEILLDEYSKSMGLKLDTEEVEKVKKETKEKALKNT